MRAPKNPQISPRKRPKQARSSELVASILDAALQVLVKEGAERFTMTRVADRAGVSVGSLYQYFPNKAAILFRLQSDEWRATSEMLRVILEDRTRPALERLRALVHAFVRSECDEALLRAALRDSAPRYHDAPEAHATREAGRRAVKAFMDEAIGESPEATRTLAFELVITTLGAVGKQVSERMRTPAEVEAYAQATADMFCAYLASIEKSSKRR
jgi:AcrR family transcriptional regulator